MSIKIDYELAFELTVVMYVSLTDGTSGKITATGLLIRTSMQMIS